ncbi:major facilitator superfamily domain-containing protein [Chaetomium sp. MPI-CAGE-AT-0009]|nr:major facilitator superfamily domain-containing protein [Chaetomium sp. MPI-CAGE-AT-0009]
MAKEAEDAEGHGGVPIPSPPDAVADELMIRLEPIPAWRLAVILACIGMGLLLSIMDTTIVATMLYSISNEFGSLTLLPWVVVSYTLSYAGCAALIARLADAVGRKPVILASFALFLGASIGCAASRNMNQLIGFRAMQGAGGAGLYSMTMIVYPEICPPALVPMISSLLGLIVAVAGVCGPIIGGLFTTYTTWRWAFWLNGPCTFIPALVLFFAWPKNFQTFTKLPFSSIDYLGSGLFLSGTVLLVFIINQVSIRAYAWDSAPTIAVLVLAGLSWVALVWWQRFASQHPRLRHIRSPLPYRILTNRVMMCTILCTICTGFVMMLTIINLPLRAEFVHLYTAVQSGVLLLPLMGSMAVGSGLGGAASAKRNNTWWTQIVSGILMLVGSALLSTLADTTSPEPKQWGFQVLLGLGVGLSLSTTTFVTSLSVEFEDHAVGQGLMAQMRVFGGSLGVASSFIVLNSMIQDRLENVLTPEELSDFYTSPVAVYSLPAFQQLKIREVYIDAFNVNMRVCLGVSALAVIAALCTYQRRPPTVQKRLDDLAELYARSTTLADRDA